MLPSVIVTGAFPYLVALHLAKDVRSWSSVLLFLPPSWFLAAETRNAEDTYGSQVCCQGLL